MIEYNADDIKEVMEITGLDKGKAEKLFKEVAKDIDDGIDDEVCSYDVIDVIKMEHKGKVNGVNRHQESGDKPKERKPRERKVDTEKAELLKMLAVGLVENDITVTTENEVKLHFNYNGSAYSVTLTKHRPPKQQAAVQNAQRLFSSGCTKCSLIFCAFLPIDKSKNVWYNGGPRSVAAAGIFVNR